MDSAVAASLDVTDRLQQLFTNVALGVIAEEALAMGVFAALTAPDFEQGVLRAVNLDLRI